MNICFFSPEFKFPSTPGASGSGASVGGMERSSSLLANELRRRGHRVDFYSFNSLPNNRLPRIPGVSVLLRCLFPSLFSVFGRSERLRFRKFLKDHKIDVAVWHSMGAIPFSLKNLPCKLVTVWRATPIFVFPAETYTNHVIKRLKIRSRFGQWLVRGKLCCSLFRKYYTFVHDSPISYALHCSGKFVLLSERFIPDFTLAKKFPQKVCAINNIAPLTPEPIDFSTKHKELLWVGRISLSDKRPDLMLQIWQRLQDRFPDWSLCFVGDGPYLPELKALAKKLGVQRVFFEGFQDPAPYYRSAPIYCMTSANEGFGLVLVEAQAFGCVPVAFESYSAVHDIIDDGVNGALVPAFDIEKYAEKVSGLMLNPKRRERLALNAQKSISKFSEKDIGDKWEKLLGGGYRKKKELLWVGRISFADKRPDFMLHIWQRLQDRFPDWSLRFVGDGKYLPELKKLSASLGLKNVYFEGYQDPVPYYRLAPIFCMTSANEGFPNVLLEAQAFSCVPIAFESFGSVRDIIDDGVNGFLVTPFNLDAYAGKLAQLMSTSELWRRFALNAQKSIAKFSPEAIGDKWEKLLLEVAG